MRSTKVAGVRQVNAGKRGLGWPGVQGFTLVELMTTILVAAVLLIIAVPSFKHITASSRLTTTANGMVDAVNVARMQAIKRNAHSQFCGSTDNGSGDLHTACGLVQPGAVYVLVGAASAASAVQVKAAPVISSSSLHLKTVDAIWFDARGLGHLAGQTAPYTGPVAIICSSSISSSNYRVVAMTTGSIMSTTTQSGTCP